MGLVQAPASEPDVRGCPQQTAGLLHLPVQDQQAGQVRNVHEGFVPRAQCDQIRQKFVTVAQIKTHSLF